MKLIFALFFVFGFSSCNLKVTELAKTYVKVFDSNQCLEDFSKNMNNYFSAKISTKEFKDFWLCFSNSIDIFASAVKGQEIDEFTVEEIVVYVSQLLDQSPVITEDLKKEIILFKQWLVGGSEVFTKAELQQISKISREITPFLLKLLESMEFYNLFIKADSVESILSKYSWQEVEAKLEEAKITLMDALEKFSTTIPKTSYSYTHFKNVSLHIGLFFNNGVKTRFSTFLERQEKLFQSVQVLLFSQNTDMKFSPAQWKKMLDFFSNSYPLFIQYILTMQGQSLSQVEKLDYFVLWINNTFKAIKSLIEDQPQKAISYSRLVPIFEVLSERSVLPFKADEELLSVLIGKFFTSREDRSSNSGLNIKSLQMIQKTIDKWTRAQVLLAGSVNQKVSSQLSLKRSAGDSLYYKRLLSIIEKNIYAFQESGIATFSADVVSDKKNTYNSFVHNNLLSLVEQIFYTYSLDYAKAIDTNKSNLSILKTELKPSEIKALTKDAFILLRSFGLIIPAEVESVSDLVRVLSQFFSYSARGVMVETKVMPCINYCGDTLSTVARLNSFQKVVSESLSFSEVFEFFSVVHSALKKTKQELVVLKQECSQNCVDFFFNKIEAASGFSALDSYFSRASIASKKEFFSLLSKNIFAEKQELTESTLFLTYSLLHFIESVMLRHDKDRSGVLDKDELTQALVIFKGLVIKLLEAEGSGSDTASIKQAFHFVLTMPIEASIWDKVSFLFNPPVLQADPLSLARVLSVLISSEE